MIAYASSLDTPGVFARTVQDASLLLGLFLLVAILLLMALLILNTEVIVKHEERDSTSIKTTSPPNYFQQLSEKAKRRDSSSKR